MHAHTPYISKVLTPSQIFDTYPVLQYELDLKNNNNLAALSPADGGNDFSMCSIYERTQS